MPPIYEYRCPVCGVVEERHRKIAERDDPISCTNNPECNGAGDAPPRMERVISAPASNFPGAGVWRGGA